MPLDYATLTADQRRKADAAVRQTHYRRTELDFTTLDGAAVKSISSARFLGGSVQGDDTRTPVEVFTAAFLDDDNALDWTYGRHRRYRVRVTDSWFVAALNDWVEEVVFSGPLWDFDRSGEVVTVIAQSGERLAMGSVRRVIDKPRKSNAAAVARELLSATGAPANAVRIPKLDAKLPERVTVGVRRGKKRPDGKDKDHAKEPPRKVQRLIINREDSYWHEAARIMAALNRDLYADNRLRFVAAKAPTRPVVALQESDLVAPVREKRGTDGDVVNTWVILGKDPKGPKRRIHAEVALPAKHPLSAQSLAWHGTPYEVTRQIENPHLARRKQAQDVGQKLRDQALRELVTYEVEALPVLPWFRPGALVSIPLPGGGRATMRVHQWTRPLGPDAEAFTLGANRRARWSS